MNDSTTKTTETPALPCPPWCESSHAGEFAGTSHQAHREFSDEAGYVTLYMEDGGVGGSEVLAYLNGRVNLHVTWRDPERSVIRPLAEAEKFAEMAEAFGRPDVATIIRELAALAAEARCAKCHAEPCKQGSPFGECCLDMCHEALEFDHCCMICATPEEARALGFPVIQDGAK